MKKSKKILATLLLSASMFLVPTVVFASENTDIIIDKWEETDDGWKAIDVNGNYINRGWAKSENEKINFKARIFLAFFYLSFFPTIILLV